MSKKPTMKNKYDVTPFSLGFFTGSVEEAQRSLASGLNFIYVNKTAADDSFWSNLKDWFSVLKGDKTVVEKALSDFYRKYRTPLLVGGGALAGGVGLPLTAEILHQLRKFFTPRPDLSGLPPELQELAEREREEEERKRRFNPWMLALLGAALGAGGTGLYLNKDKIEAFLKDFFKKDKKDEKGEKEKVSETAPEPEPKQEPEQSKVEPEQPKPKPEPEQPKPKPEPETKEPVSPKGEESGKDTGAGSGGAGSGDEGDIPEYPMPSEDVDPSEYTRSGKPPFEGMEYAGAPLERTLEVGDTLIPLPSQEQLGASVVGGVVGSSVAGRAATRVLGGRPGALAPRVRRALVRVGDAILRGDIDAIRDLDNETIAAAARARIVEAAANPAESAEDVGNRILEQLREAFDRRPGRRGGRQRRTRFDQLSQAINQEVRAVRDTVGNRRLSPVQLIEHDLAHTQKFLTNLRRSGALNEELRKLDEFVSPVVRRRREGGRIRRLLTPVEVDLSELGQRIGERARRARSFGRRNIYGELGEVAREFGGGQIGRNLARRRRLDPSIVRRRRLARAARAAGGIAGMIGGPILMSHGPREDINRAIEQTRRVLETQLGRAAERVGEALSPENIRRVTTPVGEAARDVINWMIESFGPLFREPEEVRKQREKSVKDILRESES